MVDERICQTVATKALVNWWNSIKIMGLEMWNKGVREIYCPTLGIRSFVRVKFSVNKCTNLLLFNKEMVGVGTEWLMSRVSPIFFTCVTSPLSGQCRTRIPQLHSAFRSLCRQNIAIKMWSFYGTKPWDSSIEFGENWDSQCCLV